MSTLCAYYGKPKVYATSATTGYCQRERNIAGYFSPDRRPIEEQQANRCKEPATPTPAPKANPGRTDAQRLDAYKTNLDWAIDCASLKLNRLKPGSSAYKTQAGYLRGLIDARESLISEMGARQ